MSETITSSETCKLALAEPTIMALRPLLCRSLAAALRMYDPKWRHCLRMLDDLPSALHRTQQWSAPCLPAARGNRAGSLDGRGRHLHFRERRTEHALAKLRELSS